MPLMSEAYDYVTEVYEPREKVRYDAFVRARPDGVGHADKSWPFEIWNLAKFAMFCNLPIWILQCWNAEVFLRPVPSMLLVCD